MLLSVVDLALHDQMNGRVSWDSRRPTGSRGASPCFDHTINNRVTEVGRLCGAGVLLGGWRSLQRYVRVNGLTQGRGGRAIIF
jgi:hypothetical protein